MTWKDITVEQFQQLSELWLDSSGVEPFLVMADTIGICMSLTPHMVDSLTVQEVNALAAKLAFLNEKPEWQPAKHVTVEGRRYRFIYDVQQIRAGRNIEVKHFNQEPGAFVANLHKKAASMVVPQQRDRRNWIQQLADGVTKRERWIDAPYDAARHDEYAADMLQAPITSIHGSALFFCEVWKELIPHIADFLTSTIPTKTTREEAKRLLLDSCSLLGGITTPAPSQSLTASPSTTPTTSPTSDS